MGFYFTNKKVRSKQLQWEGGNIAYCVLKNGVSILVLRCMCQPMDEDRIGGSDREKQQIQRLNMCVLASSLSGGANRKELTHLL